MHGFAFARTKATLQERIKQFQNSVLPHIKRFSPLSLSLSLSWHVGSENNYCNSEKCRGKCVIKRKKREQ